MSFSFKEISLTASSELLFSYNQPNTLLTIQAFLMPSTRSSIHNTITYYDENGVASTPFTVQTSTALLLDKVRISRLNFVESLPIAYTIHVFITVNTYTNKAIYESKAAKSSVFVIPILYGQVGVV